MIYYTIIITSYHSLDNYIFAMSTDITILLEETSTSENRVLAANNIINNYELALIDIEILKVFEFVKLRVKTYSNEYFKLYERHEFLLNYLLNNNVSMFVALIKTYNPSLENKCWHMTMLVSTLKPYKLGFIHHRSKNAIVALYRTLLDHGDFCIDDLDLPNDCKALIHKYRDEKYNGKLTKVVNKNWFIVI